MFHKEGVKRKKKKHQRKTVQHDFSTGPTKVRMYGPKGEYQMDRTIHGPTYFFKGNNHVGNEGEIEFFKVHYKRLLKVGDLGIL